MSYNKVILMGNLTRDPETRYTQKEQAVVKTSLAINRRYKKGDEWVDAVDFVDVTLFGKRGEAFAKYHTKGDTAFVEGELRLDQWESDQGEKRSKLYVVVNTWEFTGARSDKGSPRTERKPANPYGDFPE